MWSNRKAIVERLEPRQARDQRNKGDLPGELDHDWLGLQRVLYPEAVNTTSAIDTSVYRLRCGVFMRVDTAMLANCMQHAL